MTGSHRARRAIAAIALGLLGTTIVNEPCRGQDQAASLSASFRRAAMRARGALVSIRAVDGVPSYRPYAPTRPGRFGPTPMFPPMPDRASDGDARSVFSGLVVDADKGYILTIDQAGQGASQFVVTFPDGQERSTGQVRRDPRSSLALLVVEMQGLRSAQVKWGDPAKLEAGDWLIALGQPGVGDPAMSVGIFSTRRRGASEELIETDAAITRVGAGGILLNLSGEVVGICKLGGRRSDGFEGMGHAIPADRARRVADDLARFGQVQRPYLGISLEPVKPAIGGRQGASKGVVVTSVGRNTPAGDGGVRVGDVVVAVGSRSVDSVLAVQEAVEVATIGDELTLTLERQGKRLEIKLKPRAMQGPQGVVRWPGPGLQVQPRRDPRQGGTTVPDSPPSGRVLPEGPPHPPLPAPPGASPDSPED
jgi:serine protease Do